MIFNACRRSQEHNSRESAKKQSVQNSRQPSAERITGWSPANQKNRPPSSERRTSRSQAETQQSTERGRALSIERRRPLSTERSRPSSTERNRPLSDRKKLDSVEKKRPPSVERKRPTSTGKRSSSTERRPPSVEHRRPPSVEQQKSSLPERSTTKRSYYADTKPLRISKTTNKDSNRPINKSRYQTAVDGESSIDESLQDKYQNGSAHKPHSYVAYKSKAALALSDDSSDDEAVDNYRRPVDSKETTEISKRLSALQNYLFAQRNKIV